jgi:rhodanese-related sulfurtransferase
MKIFILCLLYGISITGVNSTICGEPLPQNIAMTQHTSSQFYRGGIVNVTVQEVWNMCSTTEDGITPPIDVRTTQEWQSERINTPYPEYARHYPLSSLQSASGLDAFLEAYEGKDIILYCKAGSRSAAAAQILANNNFSGTIYNMIGGITEWMGDDLPTKHGNTLPVQPLQPIGPTICGSGLPYSYNTLGADPDNDVIRYGWDWNGDEYIDAWSDYTISSNTSTMPYTWMNPGLYNVTVLAEDIVGARSPFSFPLSVLVTTPPVNPIVNGPQTGKVNDELMFNIFSNDFDNDTVSYFINWGDGTTTDGWLGPYQQGVHINVSHTWTEKNSYTLQVKAQDGHGIESGWSTFEISMPRSSSGNLGTIWQSFCMWLRFTFNSDMLVS